MTRARRSRHPLRTVGWREWIALPDLGVHAIKAKVDTGARTCALHAFDVERVELSEGPGVRFHIHPVQRNSRIEIRTEALLLDERWVRSSTGRATLRPVIRTRATLGGRVWRIEVTLIRRDVMGFRMLLGRQALRRRFLVDPGSSFLLSEAPPEAERW